MRPARCLAAARMLLLLGPIAAAALADAPTKRGDPAATEAQRLESQIRARLDAAARGDAEAWAAFVADDCLCGLETKAAIGKAMAARPPGVRNGYGPMRDFAVRLLGEVAVARYRVAETSEVGSQKTSIETWRTETYARRGGRWILVAGADTPIPPEPQAVAVEAARLEEYVGRYEYTPGAVDTVTREGERLFVQPSGEARVELLAESETSFFARGEAWRLVFLRGPDGAVSGLLFRDQGQEWRATRLP